MNLLTAENDWQPPSVPSLEKACSVVLDYDMRYHTW